MKRSKGDSNLSGFGDFLLRCSLAEREMKVRSARLYDRRKISEIFRRSFRIGTYITKDLNLRDFRPFSRVASVANAVISISTFRCFSTIHAYYVDSIPRKEVLFVIQQQFIVCG